jgi:hypothetical protein
MPLKHARFWYHGREVPDGRPGSGYKDGKKVISFSVPREILLYSAKFSRNEGR